MLDYHSIISKVLHIKNIIWPKLLCAKSFVFTKGSNIYRKIVPKAKLFANHTVHYIKLFVNYIVQYTKILYRHIIKIIAIIKTVLSNKVIPYLIVFVYKINTFLNKLENKISHKITKIRNRIVVKVTKEEFAKYRNAKKEAVDYWTRKGMPKENKGRNLRINIVKADEWLQEQFLGKKLIRFKFKKYIFSTVVILILMFLIWDNYTTRTYQSIEIERLQQENSVLIAKNNEQQTALTDYAQMQDKYATLSELGEALNVDISSTIDSLKKHGVDDPGLTIAASLDVYEYLGEWIASEAQSDKEKLNELLDKVEAVPNTWPVVSSYIFDEEGKLIENWPVGRLTSGFGWRKRIFKIANLISRDGVLYEFHTGIDIASTLGTPIVATAPGEVIATEWTDGYGYIVIIDHGYGYESWYAHLSEFRVRPGQIVERGQLIGLMGKTGSTTGSHLHFEIRLNGVPINPYEFVKLDK